MEKKYKWTREISVKNSREKRERNRNYSSNTRLQGLPSLNKLSTKPRAYSLTNLDFLEVFLNYLTNPSIFLVTDYNEPSMEFLS